MDSTTIALILAGGALLAFYTDPFGWDPSRRHERMGFSGPRDGTAAILVVLIGLVVFYHFDMLHLDSFDSEFEHGAHAVSSLMEDMEPVVGPIATGFRELGSALGEGLTDLATSVRESELAQKLGAAAPAAQDG